MTSRDLLLENKRLKQQLAEARAAIADRDAKIEKLARDLAKLEALVTQLLAQRRGCHSVPEGQGLLFPESGLAIDAPKTEGIATDESVDAAAAADDADDDDGEDDDHRETQPKTSGKRTPRKIDTTGLPREDRLHDVPEEAEHREIAPVMADLPPRPLENCAASANLLAWLLVQKFANHLPLYRQEQIFGRDGKRLPRQTLCDWQLASAEQLLAIVECLFRRIRAGPCMQLDDTPVMCQGGRGEPHFQACLWTFVNPEVDGVVYRFTPGRASEPLAAEIGDFSGTLVGDGYSGNRAAANKATGEIAIAGCWAHVNRKFRDAEKEAPGTAKLFRNDIRRLYEIEREADKAALDATARAALRQQEAPPILAGLFDMAQRQADQFSESGTMAKAIGYLIKQQKPLQQYLTDGRIPIDNNACERAIRPIAIGRRNWLFAGSMRGGRAAAVIYTLVECCRLAKVDMVAYFADVLVRVGTHQASRVQDLLPANWAKHFATPAAELAPA